MTRLRLLNHYAFPESITGHIIEARLPEVAVGEICEIYADWLAPRPVAKAQVVGFYDGMARLNLIGHPGGINRQCVIKPTRRELSLRISDLFLGAVVDATGTIVERLAPAGTVVNGEERKIDTSPPSYLQRQIIDQPLLTGIRVIDGMLTCGTGQRVGIFSSAGCGKTVLMHMLVEHTEADVFVIALIGERGREVTECVAALRSSARAARSVVVYATSDFSSVDRCNAALLATTVAEFFRDQGKKVVLFVDSLTRYARARRDMTLAAGEPPARRGYPASVFDSLPRLLERPGNTHKGSITAFYTVLLEGEEETDPLGDEVRSLLDGHIYLTRKLAGQGHYPAIDVLRSISRVFGQVTVGEHRELAGRIRGLMTTLEDLQVFLDLGEYKPGQNSDNDRAMNARAGLMQWLRQSVGSSSDFRETLKGMKNIVG